MWTRTHVVFRVGGNSACLVNLGLDVHDPTLLPVAAEQAAAAVAHVGRAARAPHAPRQSRKSFGGPASCRDASSGTPRWTTAAPDVVGNLHACLVPSRDGWLRWRTERLHFRVDTGKSQMAASFQDLACGEVRGATPRRLIFWGPRGRRTYPPVQRCTGGWLGRRLAPLAAWRFFGMTTLVGWAAIDSRGPTSLYFASDSRFTWAPGVTWDYGRKLFASRSRPDILGYCGDVLFASHTIGQALEHLEAGILYPADAELETRVTALEAFLGASLRTYPDTQRRDFSVIYASRLGTNMAATFIVEEIAWASGSGWSRKQLPLPKLSDVVLARGSGADAFSTRNVDWRGGDIGRTSRAVYSAFCDHVAGGADASTGGAPQLVGLHRSGPAVTFGTIFGGRRWLSGAPVDGHDQLPELAWRDELFQRCDGNTMAPLPDAQRHARPNSL